MFEYLDHNIHEHIPFARCMLYLHCIYQSIYKMNFHLVLIQLVTTVGNIQYPYTHIIVIKVTTLL